MVTYFSLVTVMVTSIYNKPRQVCTEELEKSWARFEKLASLRVLRASSGRDFSSPQFLELPTTAGCVPISCSSGALDDHQLGQVSVLLSEIDTVASHEHILYVETVVVNTDLNLATSRFVEQRANLQAPGMPRGQKL